MLSQHLSCGPMMLNVLLKVKDEQRTTPATIQHLLTSLLPRPLLLLSHCLLAAAGCAALL